MGNKLSCSCAPLVRKVYNKYEDAPWQTPRRRDGHLLRLWAEVFHVTTSGGGNTKWQQVSEDLVPVNITCIQDSPEYLFHITAYNSQVDKILDVRLVQPGTRIGQASECFVYWKDPLSNDTWGLNFTSPIDAKQFRECCSPSFKFSRKASSSYSLKLEPPHKQKIKTKRKPVSTPVSPNRSREPQCTCMTNEQTRLKINDFKAAASTLPRTQSKPNKIDGNEKITAVVSTTSLYDNVSNQGTCTKKNLCNQAKSKTTQEVGTMTNFISQNNPVTIQLNNHLTSSQISENVEYQSRISDPQLLDSKKSEGTQINCNTIQFNTPKSSKRLSKFSTVYSTSPHSQSLDNYTKTNHYDTQNGTPYSNRPKSKSIDHAGSDTVYSDNEIMRRKHLCNEKNNHDINNRPESTYIKSLSREYPGRGLCLELDHRNSKQEDLSPPSDNVIFDNQCYATTPSSSNNSDSDQQPVLQSNQNKTKKHHKHKMSQTNRCNSPGSPTSRLLLEYEMHLRNTLAKGMDAESYSLHTFEALLTQSMENLEFAESLPRPNIKSSFNKSSTLPSTHRNFGRIFSDRDGYYSDRNETHCDIERERDKGYLSDHSTSYNNTKCASCIDESSRAHWFRHSDGWRSASSSFGSSNNFQCFNSSLNSYKRSPWDSLPSLRHDNSLGDSGYKSNRTDSFEQSEREYRYGVIHQASVDSTDSRLCYLTSSEISDDDRMSLTTAVSDEEEPENTVHSPYRVHKSTATTTASFNCTGAVRKAGFLSVKKWLLRKKHQIELARKRGWKGYWVCLKGTTLLFYPCDSRDGRSVDATPKHLIIVDGAIMQAIPEHPKRDYIFCLSTAFGDAYLFQAPCQIELENWINSIHSACAAAFARHRGKTGTLHLLQEEIYRLEKTIESDYKLKHMADLQQSVLNDVDTKQHILNQIIQWEENLERLHCEQFRLKCYMASLQSRELPNPKCLLTHVSRATKSTLNKLGVFTVSSFHAFICARSPSLLNNLLAGRGATKRRAPLLSRSNSASSKRSLQNNNNSEDLEKNIKVFLPDSTYVLVHLRDTMTAEEFLAYASFRKNLNPTEHFLRVKKRRDMDSHNYFVPNRTDIIENYINTHEVVELCPKIVYQVDLSRNTIDHMWGFSVEAELVENTDRQDELCCYVSRVEDKSVAMKNGIIKGDEIMVINGAIVSDLDMMYIESVLQEELSLSMMVRSSRTEPPELLGIIRTTDDIEKLVCPPPPSDPNLISEEMISELIVPAPNKEINGSMNSNHSVSQDTQLKSNIRANSFEIENLLKSAEQVTGICRSPENSRKSTLTELSNVSQSIVSVGTATRQLSDADKLRKVIMELIETERIYVKNLNILLDNYLEPLKKETFLSSSEIDTLFGNINEINSFQKEFLRNLNESLEYEIDFHKFDNPSQFKSILFSIGNAFLYYVNQFKLYSSFCASHGKAQKVLHPSEENHALQEFLASKNPKQQHSATLESFLIKPIQRILKYPLLLQQLKSLTNPVSDEHKHLTEALKGMEKVAEHINEMQRIHEEYGAIFDHLFRQHHKSFKMTIDLNPGDLLYYGGVEWLNIADFLGKIKKGLELHAMCFVFKSAVVFLCKEKHRQKKKVMGVTTKTLGNSEVEIIRYQVLIPVSEVQVRTSTTKDMDMHFIWELIHLRSQIQRRSEKVYILSNSTGEFRNAFLKTIRQIIRESVRNMSIPSTKTSLSDSGSNLSSVSKDLLSSYTLERPTKHTVIVQGSNTVGKIRNAQRHSSGNITFDKRNKMDTGTMPKNKPETAIKSEGEEESRVTVLHQKKKEVLGRTPNYLTLSTTSTLSASSSGSQAKLVQASNQPETYQPKIITKDLGSPVWKPRDTSLEISVNSKRSDKIVANDVDKLKPMPESFTESKKDSKSSKKIK